MGHVLRWRDGGFAVHDPEVDEEVFVSGGWAERVGFDRTEHGLDFACYFADGHVGCPFGQSTRRNGGYTIANRAVRITSRTPLIRRASGVPMRSASAPNGQGAEGHGAEGHHGDAHHPASHPGLRQYLRHGHGHSHRRGANRADNHKERYRHDVASDLGEGSQRCAPSDCGSREQDSAPPHCGDRGQSEGPNQ